MRHAYRHIKKTVKNAQVSKLDDTIKVLFPMNVMFTVNGTTIDSNAWPSIQNIAKSLNKYHKTGILINGHTDSSGSDEYNNNLSTIRADTARKALEVFNVIPERMIVWGLGERHPAASNATEEGRSKNRRVEFIILYKP